MTRLYAVLLSVMALFFATSANSRTLQYPVIFIHGVWSDATTWETAIKQLTDRSYIYGGVVSASYSNGVPNTAGCVIASSRNNTSPTVYLSACDPNADFFVWDSTDRKGLRIAVRDLNGDGRAELIAATADPANGFVRVIPYEQFGHPSGPLQNPLINPITLDGLYPG